MSHKVPLDTHQQEPTYKVIKIISDDEIIINAGRNAGLTSKDKLEIFVPGSPVTDPDTGEELGKLDLIKATLAIRRLSDKMCVCTNASTTNSLSDIAEGLVLFPSKPRRLNVDPTEITGGYPNTDTTIKIGDLVRKTI